MPSTYRSHTTPIGSFVVLPSGRTVRITKHLTARPASSSFFPGANNLPWYEAVDAYDGLFNFPQSSIISLASGFPTPPLAVTSVSPGATRRIRIAPRVSTPSRPRRSASVTVSWPTVETGEYLNDYDTEAQRVVEFLTDTLPAGIADRVLERWADVLYAGPANETIPKSAGTALRRLARKLRA